MNRRWFKTNIILRTTYHSEVIPPGILEIMETSCSFGFKLFGRTKRPWHTASYSRKVAGHLFHCAAWCAGSLVGTQENSLRRVVIQKPNVQEVWDLANKRIVKWFGIRPFFLASCGSLLLKELFRAQSIQNSRYYFGIKLVCIQFSFIIIYSILSEVLEKGSPILMGKRNLPLPSIVVFKKRFPNCLIRRAKTNCSLEQFFSSIFIRRSR